MHDTTVSQKIAAPILPSVLLHRQLLVKQLEEAIIPEGYKEGRVTRYKLVLCCAPAGYGKTTLLADFVHTASLPCCWYFLEPTDCDPIVFLRTLLASLRHTFPQFGASLDPLFHMGFPEGTSEKNVYYSMLATLCTSLAGEVSERFVLILCNYERINESDMLNNLVNFLLEKLPPQTTLIIESRAIPDLSFTPLVIKDAMCGLDRDALRFSAEDITELAQLQGVSPLKEEEAASLATSFDGWIAGILLGTRVGDARVRLLTQPSFAQQEKQLPLFQVNSLVDSKRKMLLTYLVDDILKHDKNVHAFLQGISILQQIEPDICNTLLGMTDAADYLARLERQGLFITSYESVSGIIYACHPVIRELLCEQLRLQEPQRFQELHRQAAEFWCAHHNDEQALYHAFESEDYSLAVSLILNTSDSLLQQGQYETLTRWLYMLPLVVQENEPLLFLLQASIALERGLHGMAAPLCSRAEALILAASTPNTKVLLATAAVLRSKALFQAGDYAQAQALCLQALRDLPEQEQALRAFAEMRLGICANLQGNFTAGITHLQQALRIWSNQPPPHQAIQIHSALANTYYLTGNFPLAQYHLTTMLGACEQAQNIHGKVSALVLQGLIAQDQGLTSEAEALFLRVLKLTRASPFLQRGETHALVNLGELCIEQGQYVRALDYIQEGLRLARTFGNRSIINAAFAGLALSYLFLGDSTSALLMVEQMETQTRDKKTVGYERVWHDLTYGFILFSLQRYSEAHDCLVALEAALRTTHLTRGSIQAKLRLAACQLMRHQQDQAIGLLEEVTSLLLAHDVYKHVVQIELRWLPDLHPLVQSYVQLAPLRELAGITEPSHQPQPVVSSIMSEDVPTPQLTIYAFGEPAVLLDEQPIKRWRMTHTMELFFFLLDAQHPVSKEAILTALWPAYTEQTPQTFHNTLYYLRKLLGENCVVLHPAGYSLDLTACYRTTIWYDVQLFECHQLEAEQALVQKQDECARDALLKMVQLYRGDYGRSFYNDWCTRRRDTLRSSYLEARSQLAQIAWRAEDWNESAEHWRQVLCLDDCLEEAHYGLMRCYTRQGKRGAALRQYQLCQETLLKEFGIQPSDTLQQLYQRLTTKRTVE